MYDICNISPDIRLARLGLAEASKLNGIEYIEVLDRQMPGGMTLQQTLIVVCIKDLPEDGSGGIAATNVVIEGGQRIKDVKAAWAYRGTAFYDPAIEQPPSTRPNGVGEKEFEAISKLLANRFVSRLERVLVVGMNQAGDLSNYSLSLVESYDTATPHSHFDFLLSSVGFSFKAECASNLDCGEQTVCPIEERPAPTLDYLAKDYESFRSLMLDRLSVTMPDWKERSPADVGVTLVELLAYVGDQLTYYQDVVSNEAYLGTSRLRTSVRRHTRLLDYRLQEGCNARTWVRMEAMVETVIPKQTQLLSRQPQVGETALSAGAAALAIEAGATVFETMANVTLYPDCNTIQFHTWGAPSQVLRKGSTCATIRDTGERLEDKLKVGDLLALVEVRSPQTGLPEDADPQKRQVVRLTSVSAPIEDRLCFEDEAGIQPQRVRNVEWAQADALTFDLCVTGVRLVEGGPMYLSAEAWGNIVLADHGRTREEPAIVPTPVRRRAEAPLLYRPLTFQAQVMKKDGNWDLFDPADAAKAALAPAATRSMPAIELVELDDSKDKWTPCFDLLESKSYDLSFVVETEDDGTATLRFGDGINGDTPEVSLKATYRVGSGSGGNIGQDTLVHIVGKNVDWSTVVRNVSNVVPAVGGRDPESIEHAIQVAPHAFRVQERAVTEADYAAMAERHPEVQRAVAARRFLGSWDVFFISIDRRHGKPVDAAFLQEMRDFIERYRLAGHDVEILAPAFVPLDIVLPICVSPHYLRSHVLTQLQEIFSAVDLPNGQKGFFHPDNFTFGQPVLLSQIVVAAMSVPGVQAVLTDPDGTEFAFRRLQSQDDSGETTGVLKMGLSEIATVANDVNQPMGGKIEFRLRGGL